MKKWNVSKHETKKRAPFSHIWCMGLKESSFWGRRDTLFFRLFFRYMLHVKIEII